MHVCSGVVSEQGCKYLDLAPRPKGWPRWEETHGGNMQEEQGWPLLATGGTTSCIQWTPLYLNYFFATSGAVLYLISCMGMPIPSKSHPTHPFVAPRCYIHCSITKSKPLRSLTQHMNSQTTNAVEVARKNVRGTIDFSQYMKAFLLLDNVQMLQCSEPRSR